ncbi:A24 family peptidase [Streptomyces sp. BE147]|uniref:A24 family peptidase n=1 Tax=Streptomyces sp. BE147 TaxID=3002524 RepID=UPI002E75F222|nr:A24 family peptidase [Streptomyces sp. BE147]MEE1741782.1 A24 family peptidase [Streptomyces sp. BE147]
MDATLIAVAALWGAATGLLVPRAAYRFSVEPEEAWRDSCPAGHPLTGPGGGWFGPARCTACASVALTPAPRTTAPADDGPDGDRAPEATEDREAASGPEATADAPADAVPGPVPGADRIPVAPGGRYAPRVLAPVITALACTALAAGTGTRPELAAWLLLAPVAVLLAVVDSRVHRLPDPLTLPLAGAAVLLLGAVALLPEHAGSWTSGLLGGLALGGFYFVLFLINPNGMGFGDVKLALALGIALGWYGWAVLFVGAFAGFLYGAVYGLALVILRRAGRRTGIPFGPFMIAGALTGLLLGALAA